MEPKHESPIDKTGSPERLKVIWPTNTFVHSIEEGVKRHPVSIEDLPDIIELEGNIPEIADRLIEETFKDPLKRERVVTGKVDLNDRLVIDPNEVVGTELNAGPKFEYKVAISKADGSLYKREYGAFMMHTHGAFDLPASFADFKFMICNQDFAYAVQSQIVLTRSTKMLFMRTLQTPEIDPPDEALKILDEKEKIHRAEANKEISESGVVHPHGVWTAKNMKFVLEFCKEYNIGAYISYEGHRYTRLDV